MKIFMATWLIELAQKTALDNTGKKERLLSYFYLKDEKKNKTPFLEYVK